MSKRDRQCPGPTHLAHALQHLGHGRGDGGATTHQEVVQTLNILHHLVCHQQVRHWLHTILTHTTKRNHLPDVTKFNCSFCTRYSELLMKYPHPTQKKTAPFLRLLFVRPFALYWNLLANKSPRTNPLLRPL